MEELDILVCAECGSRDIETQAWVKINENNRCNGYMGLEDDENNWCCNCEEHVEVVTPEEFETRKAENEQED